MERYRLMEMLNYIATEVHKGIGQLFNKAMPDDFKEDSVKKGLAAKQFPFIEKALAGKDYLLGDFTVADGYLFTVLNWTKLHNIDLSGFPNITRVHEARRGAAGGAGGDEGGRAARRRRLSLQRRLPTQRRCHPASPPCEGGRGQVQETGRAG